VERLLIRELVNSMNCLSGLKAKRLLLRVEVTPEVTPETTPEEVIDDTPITPEIPEPEEEIDRSASSGAGGLDLASWATGFRKARSARQKSGRTAQGLASQKKNPFKSWA
jgi:hypothetical protein